MNKQPTVLITGAAKRIGKATAEAFAKRGCNLLLHYNHSQQNAESLKLALVETYQVECQIYKAELDRRDAIASIIEFCIAQFDRLDYLVNNASLFYPTPFETVANSQIDQLLQVNSFAPRLLAKHCAPLLKQNSGAIVNLIDIYADAGLDQHTAYVTSKSLLKGITQDLAHELAPEVRVNGVSPGAILWPDATSTQGSNGDAEADQKQSQILEQSAMKRLGSPQAIAATIAYLALDANYTTGSVINVDGGRRDYI